jgi:hypothetical protein
VEGLTIAINAVEGLTNAMNKIPLAASTEPLPLLQAARPTAQRLMVSTCTAGGQGSALCSEYDPVGFGAARMMVKRTGTASEPALRCLTSYQRGVGALPEALTHHTQHDTSSAPPQPKHAQHKTAVADRERS